MYIEIKENKLLSWCEKPYLDYEYVDIDYSTFEPTKYEVQEGKLVDVSETQEYQDKIVQREKATTLANLRLQIEEIDKKRIRALCEPSAKDEPTGQTWIEYYNLLVQELRNQIAELG